MPKTKQDDDSFCGAPSSRYSRITLHTKDKLCYIVITTSLKVKSAAKILKINSSTAKMIIKKFYQMSLEDQKQTLERGAKSKKEKSDNTIKKKPTNQCQNKKNQVLDCSNKHKTDEEQNVLVKSQLKVEEEFVMVKDEDKKQQQTSQNHCLYFYCPIYNFPSF